MRRRVAAFKATVTVVFSDSRLSSRLYTIIINLPKPATFFCPFYFFLLFFLENVHLFSYIKKESRSLNIF